MSRVPSRERGFRPVARGWVGVSHPDGEKERLPLLPTDVSLVQNAVQAPPDTPRESVCDSGLRKCDESYPKARSARNTTLNAGHQHRVWSAGTGWLWAGKEVCVGPSWAGAVRTHFKSSEVRWTCILNGCRREVK